MMILKIYVAIGLICFALFILQIKVLIVKEEKRLGGHYVPKEKYTFLEKFLAVLKLIIIFSIPIFRIVVTGCMLFSETMQNDFLDKYDEMNDFEYNEEG